MRLPCDAAEYMPPLQVLAVRYITLGFHNVGRTSLAKGLNRVVKHVQLVC